MANERPSMNERIAVEKRNRMAEIETAYLRAKEYEKSEEWITDQIRALAKIRAVVRQGLMEEAESLQMIGRVQQILLDTYHHENVILEYEGLRSSLKEMFGEK